MTRKLFPVIAAVLFLGATAAPARADVTLTPFVGGLFSGNLPDAKTTYGASLAVMGKGIFGAEFDFSWAPKFVDATSTNADVREANMMGNLIVGIPIGGTHGASIRPYVVGGVGLIRATEKESDFLDPIRSNDFGYNFGGGIMGMFATHFGVRGDLRYFRTNSAENDYHFWRGTGGLAIKF